MTDSQYKYSRKVSFCLSPALKNSIIDVKRVHLRNLPIGKSQALSFEDIDKD